MPSLEENGHNDASKTVHVYVQYNRHIKINVIVNCFLVRISLISIQIISFSYLLTLDKINSVKLEMFYKIVCCLRKVQPRSI